MASDLKEYYRNLYVNHGRKSEAVQHVSFEEQSKRFKILTENVGYCDNIIDLGCGLADLYAYLNLNSFNGQYLGLDFVKDFIDSNNEFYKDHANCQFRSFDINSEDIPKHFDHIVLSGVFNNIMPNNDSFMKMTVQKMYKAASQTISFNMLSTYVDYQEKDLYYFDPKFVFEFCKTQISPLVTIKHDYGLGSRNFPYEFTVFIRKK